METYHGIGVMSGTSHDGLDLAYCNFFELEGHWHFNIIEALTIPYTDEWRERLLSLPQARKKDIKAANLEYGDFIGKKVFDFIRDYDLEADFVASHGHTVFHDPAQGITLQIGDGAAIANACGLTVVHDFRSADVAMGGQGAPLVPVGDRMLFPEFDFCLNLGGIANISYEEEGNRIAFDICPANIILNQLAQRIGKPYDKGGRMASMGSLNKSLLEELEALPFYRQQGPKSLGREWVEGEVLPLIRKYRDRPVIDLLATFTEHIASRIVASTENKDTGSMLVTGGGAYNDHIIGRLRKMSSLRIILPEPQIIEYKEAMVFAFLGLLRLKGMDNVLGSVTGSGKNHSAGTITKPL